MQCPSHQNPKQSELPLDQDRGAAGVGMAGSCPGTSSWAMPVLGMRCTDTDAVTWGNLDLSSHKPITTLCPASCWS